MKRSHLLQAPLLLVVLFAFTQVSGAYSILTHEQIVDLLWKDRIQPLIEARFPGLTDDDLKKAHAYAYGGSLVQDMGYYPFGSRYFSDLTHYVRTGDFILCLLQQARTANEYAFALGALAHYASDNAGHPTVNHVVALEFPGLRKKFGDVVTYVDSPTAHIRAEFGFDMTQVAKNRYTSDRYHDFVGFEISKELLQRVFPMIYGILLTDVIHNEDLAIGTFRRAVSNVIPETTRVALLARKKEMVADTPDRAHRKYMYYLSRTDYDREWGTNYHRPGFGTRFLAIILKMLPKKGPLRGLSFKVPNSQEEDLFVKSIDATVETYGQLLTETKNGTLHLANKDCDTGKDTRPGEYSLTDLTYARLLNDLATSGFKDTSVDLKDNIVDFYKNPNIPQATQHKKKKWKQVETELEQLKQSTPPQAPVNATSSLEP